MGINSNNVRVVIHMEAPMSMSYVYNLLYFYFYYILIFFFTLIANLIQEAGCAGRNGNMAKHFIFYSKKDICTNYSIIAEYQETLVIKNNFLILCLYICL